MNVVRLVSSFRTASYVSHYRRPLVRYLSSKRQTKDSKTPSSPQASLGARRRKNVPLVNLNESEAQLELIALNEQIELHDLAYYDLNCPSISDHEYDRLVRRAVDLEGKFPSHKGIVKHLKRVGLSPRVGGGTKFGPFEHKKPLLSLDNAFDFDDLSKFITKCSNKLALSNNISTEYVVEPKIDGLSLALLYREGILVGAGTRGDGQVGENVTINSKYITGVPTNIPATGFVEVRGEVYLSSRDFAEMNEKRLLANQSIFATPRNAAAGSLRQIDSSLVKERNLRFFAYELIIGSNDSIQSSIAVDTQARALSALMDLGFSVASPWIMVTLPDDNVLLKEHLLLMGGLFRREMGYDTDGCVLKINSFDQRAALGQVSRYPNWAIAYKFSSDEATTLLEDIHVQVGRTGVLTPVAVLKKVSIGGVFVERATLHNELEVRRLKLNPGMMVRLKRSGDVIPKIIGAVEGPGGGDDKEYKEYSLSSSCPVCGSATEREDGGILVRCTGGALVCSAQAIESVKHFCSRAAADIDGLGSAKAEELFSLGLVKSPADIYKLRRFDLDVDVQFTDSLRGRKGWGDRSVNNLLAAIDRRRVLPMQKFIFALGIRHVGLETAKDLSRKFLSFNALWTYINCESVKRSDSPDYGSLLNSIDGVGPKAAESILSLARDQRSRLIVEDLMNEISIQDFIGEAEAMKEFNLTSLSGQTIVLTGKFLCSSRKVLENVCIARGAFIGNGVTKKSTLLVEGDEPIGVGISNFEEKKLSTKALKARELGVKFLSETEFIALFDIEV